MNPISYKLTTSVKIGNTVDEEIQRSVCWETRDLLRKDVTIAIHDEVAYLVWIKIREKYDNGTS